MIKSVTIAIAADHRGFELKNFIINNFNQYNFVDVGCNSIERTDYPVYAKKACMLIRSGVADCGILICYSGIGMSIAANRFEKIYAALVWNENIAELSKRDDNANVIVLPAGFITEDECLKIIKSWMDASFKGDRYGDRIKMIDDNE